MTESHSLLDEIAKRLAGRDSDESSDSGAWWRRTLGDAPPLHDLPSDFERSSRGSGTDRTVDRPLASPVDDAELLAAFASTVRRYTGGGIVVGVVAEGYTLPAPLGRDPATFAELLDEARRRPLEAAEHALPFDRLVESLDVEATAAYRPVAQLAFGRREDLAAVRDDEAFPGFDLTLQPEGSGDGYTVAFDSDLFRRDTVERFCGHLEHLLDQGREAPDRGVDALTLPTPDERRTILEEWNDTDVPVDLDRCFHDLFEAQVGETPEAVAVVEPGRGELTYAELERRSNRLAHLLVEKGVEPEELVAICTERSLELVVGILGILKAGGAYLPINPTYPEDRIGFILEETDPPVAVTESSVDGIFEGADADLVRLDGDAAELEARPETPPETDVEPENLAYVVYTSGSTGRPKGVMNEHRNVVNLAATLGPAFGVESDDRVSQFVSETFDATIWEFAMTFPRAAALVLLPSGRPPLGPELGRYLRDQEVTIASLPPAVVPDIPREMASGVETMIVAGEACPAKVVERWAPGRRFINGYGPRETTAYATCADCEPGDDPPPIGRPLGNYKTYVLDENRKLLPVGVEGELYIGGPGVGRGYLERPKLNAEKFVSDPFVDDEDARMYRTGDIVRWRRDGQLEFVGRRDFQVQLRGFRVELGAIEEAMRGHGGVRDAVATKYAPDEGPERLVGYVVAEPGADEAALPDALEDHLRQTLPDYMVPASIEVLEAFPLNTTGKVDRQALPAPDLAARDRADDRVAPRSETERGLVETWREMLPVDEIGVRENFFDLGGTSLMMARLALRIEERFDTDIPVHTLYETPTVAAIADRIDRTRADETSDSRLCFDPSLELERESRLADDIDPSGSFRGPFDEPEHLLLTGATGFVGVHLLAELLERTDARLHCLVRATDASHARERIEESAEAYDIERDLEDRRIRPVVGDLASEQLGLAGESWERLAAEMDAIYHNGAMVDQVRSYDAVKGPNVGGTERMLRVAATGTPTPFHYVSTTGSVYYPDFRASGSVPESTEAGPLEELPNGYMQSKCVGEHLVDAAVERGLPASIYRLGAVSGHTETGACEPADFTNSILRSVIDLGVAPDLDPDLMITPVDFVARAVASLSMWDDGTGKRFHVTHPAGTRLQEVVDALERRAGDVERLPYPQFIERLSASARDEEETPLVRFLPYLAQRRPEAEDYVAESYYVPVDWDCSNLREGLAARGEPTEPPPSDALVELYLEQLARRGYL